jgi:lipopolysaccharide/colanic/teichoic acid biosynthesis glycosyltransferase
MKRAFDATAALLGLLLASPILAGVMVAIWLYDFASPFYLARRVGRDGRVFRMIKFRSMVVNADKIGGSSTAEDDPRITPIGRLVRKYKLDELIQLWNVLKGDMSLVGPRPQVEVDARMYTAEERRMLSVRPGVTDLASIVFADEGEILRGSADPDLLYNQIIRPWKSRLALLYVDHRSFLMDLWIIVLTAVALVSRSTALRGVQRILERRGADEMLRTVARRDRPLFPYPPPGAAEVVSEYPR